MAAAKLSTQKNVYVYPQEVMSSEQKFSLTLKLYYFRFLLTFFLQQTYISCVYYWLKGHSFNERCNLCVDLTLHLRCADRCTHSLI